MTKQTLKQLTELEVQKEILLHQIRLLENQRENFRLGYIPGLLIIVIGFCLLVIGWFL